METLDDRGFTPTDEKLAEFFDLQEQIRHMTARLDVLKDEFRRKGSFSTRHFVCLVTEQTRTGMAPLDQIEKIIPKAELEQMGLLRTAVFKTVKVSYKG